MPKVDQVVFVKSGDVINGQLVTYDHRYVKDSCGDICEHFISVIPECVWNKFMSIDQDLNDYNFKKIIEELHQQIQFFPYKDLEQLKYEGDELEQSGSRPVSINHAIVALNFKNYNQSHEKYIFLKDNGPYGNIGYPLLKVFYKGREIFVNYPQIIAITYSTLKILLPGEYKKRLKLATKTLLLALQTQKCSAGKMVVCIEYFLRTLSETGDPILENIVKIIIDKEDVPKYLPINLSQAEQMFDFLTNMSVLFLDVIPRPTDDLCNNYNDNPYSFTLFSRQHHYDNLVINHCHLSQKLYNLEIQMETLKEEAFNKALYRGESGEYAVAELIETEFFRQLLVEHDETIPKLLQDPNGAIKRIRSGVGYDPHPDLRSSKVFLQICWALFEESINAGKQVGSKIEDIFISTEEDEDQRHFGNMQDTMMRSAREELQKFRIWVDRNNRQGVYQGLHNVEVDLLIKWGAVVKCDPVIDENFEVNGHELLELFYDLQSQFKDLLEILMDCSQEYFLALKQNIKQDLSLSRIFEIITFAWSKTDFAEKKYFIKVFDQLTKEVIPTFNDLFLKSKPKLDPIDQDVTVFDLFLPLSNLLIYDLCEMINKKEKAKHLISILPPTTIAKEIKKEIGFDKKIEEDFLAKERTYEQQYEFFSYRAHLAVQAYDHHSSLDFYKRAKYFAWQAGHHAYQTYQFLAQQSLYFTKGSEQHTYYIRQMYLAKNRQSFFAQQVTLLEEQIIYATQQCKYQDEYYLYQTYLREQQFQQMYYPQQNNVFPAVNPVKNPLQQPYAHYPNAGAPRVAKKYMPPM